MEYQKYIESAKNAFDEKMKEILGKKKKPTILVCGYTGTGKTTLIQSILGKRTVPDNRIVHGKPGTMGFQEYKDDFITLLDSRGFEPGMVGEEFIETIKEFIDARQKSDDVQDHIHLVWYCISGAGARVTAHDIKLIKDVFPYRNLEVVVTKSDITKEHQKHEIFKELLANGVQEEKITFVSEEIGDKGIDILVRKSVSNLSEIYKKAFISKQQIKLEYKKVAANKLINKTATQTGILGIIPLVDLFLILPMQMKMAAGLADIYGFDKELATEIIGGTAFTAAVASALVTATTLDSLPIVGQILSAFTVGGITKAMGHLISDYFLKCNQHIIRGGDVNLIEPLNPKAIKDYLEEKFFK